MPNIAAMLAAGREIKARLDELLLRANVQDAGEHRVAAVLCLTIAEQFAATLHLIEGGFSSHAPVMVRSMLEGQANLLNLVANPEYVDQLRYDNARADVVLFTEYAADPGMQDNVEAQETMARWRAAAQPVRDELEAQGYGKLDVPQRFRLAGIVFCSFAHNQLTTLLARHADRFELRYHAEAPAELTAGLLNIAISILCQAGGTASRFTDLPEAELQQVIDAADATWGAAQAAE
jgi:hypothetical protein